MTQEALTNQQYINLSMFRVSVPRRARNTKFSIRIPCSVQNLVHVTQLMVQLSLNLVK